MKTNITKTFHVPQPIEKVWVNLSQPAIIVGCVPGAKLTEEIDDKNFKGEVSMKFGPIKAQYAGDINFLEMDAVNHKMLLKGRGVDSKGKGSADLLMNGLLTEKDGGTDVEFSMEISVMGMLAQFGSRLINDVTDQLLKDFAKNFSDKLAGEDVDNTLNAGKFVGSMVKNKIGGIFGGNKEKDEES